MYVCLVTIFLFSLKMHGMLQLMIKFQKCKSIYKLFKLDLDKQNDANDLKLNDV